MASAISTDQAPRPGGFYSQGVRAGGGSLADLVQVTVYVTDIEHWGEFNEAYRDFMKDVPFPPARAVVPVKDLHFGGLVEIQAIAMVGGGGPSR